MDGRPIIAPEIAVALLVLAACALPTIRLLARPAVRRTFPRLWLASVGAILLLAFGAVALAYWLPTVLLVVAAGVAGSLLLASIRARPSAGRRRGLPRGSLSLLTSLGGLADRRFYLDASRRHGPVFKMSQLHRPTVCVVGLGRGHEIMREHGSALLAPPLPFSREIEEGFLRYMEVETHERYGPLFRRALARPVVSSAVPVARAAAARELALLAASCERTGEALAPVPAFRRVVFDTYARALFGIEPGSEVDREFRSAYEPLDRWKISGQLGAQERAATARLHEVLRAFLASAGASVVAGLSELHRLDPSMPNGTALDNLIFTHKIAVSNTTGLLQWIVALLGRDPAWIERLRVAPRSHDGDDLVSRTVSEALRLSQSEYVYRSIVADIHHDRFLLPEGWLLRFCVWESHRDPAVFPDPECFDPDRFLRRRYSSDEYAPFGYGRHACNGIALNEIACRAVIEELADGYQWETVGDGPPAREPRHWQHWRTAPTLALHLRPRSAVSAAPSLPLS